jgi:ubiquinone/menaquinone biosynthesis C-methylase UbiE
METHQKLYDLQSQHIDADCRNEERKKIHESWFRDNTVDFWRHKRMYETIQPVTVYFQKKKWLSIGDGRFGLDSYRLKSLFNIDVFPTDLSKNMLAIGKDKGIINKFKIENAENLSFSDNQFDIVFCKESFHHFPRPMIALYEMLRVSKYAVILIEPNDFTVLRSPKSIVKSSLKWLLSKFFKRSRFGNYNFSIFSYKPHSFEESGNYVYPLSKRELEKFSHALNLKEFAWIGLNDFYVKGCEFETAEPHNEVFKKVQKKIKKLDNCCKWLPGFFDWNLITAVLFKKEINNKIIKEMQSFGYKFVKILPNPHL